MELKKKNLAGKLQARVKEKLVTGLVTSKKLSDDEIIDEAAEAGAQIVIRHRKEIKTLKGHEERLLDQLEEDAKIIEPTDDNPTPRIVPTKEQSITLKNLAGTREKRIKINYLCQDF